MAAIQPMQPPSAARGWCKKTPTPTMIAAQPMAMITAARLSASTWASVSGPVLAPGLGRRLGADERDRPPPRRDGDVRARDGWEEPDERGALTGAAGAT
jgi:hypothetical protein